jgi:hypothetical protein
MRSSGERMSISLSGDHRVVMAPSERNFGTLGK